MFKTKTNKRSSVVNIKVLQDCSNIFIKLLYKKCCTNKIVTMSPKCNFDNFSAL